MSIATTSHDTCGRLLAAAIEVFTEVGYREANNAAVNYHFRDKEHLYLAVIEHAIQTMHEFRARAQTDPSVLPDLPEDRLRRFIHSILTDLLGQGPPIWLLKLVGREIAEPTAGLDLLVEKVIVPLEAELASIVRDLAGPAASEQRVRDCASSIFAQCHQYYQDRTVIIRMGRYTAYDPATIDHLADHITRFSLAGIHAVTAH